MQTPHWGRDAQVLSPACGRLAHPGDACPLCPVHTRLPKLCPQSCVSVCRPLSSFPASTLCQGRSTSFVESVCLCVIQSWVRTRCGWVPRCWWCCYVVPVSRRKHNRSPVWKRPERRRGNRLSPSPLSAKSLLTCWRVWPSALRGSSASASCPRSASRRLRWLVCQPLSCWSSIGRYNLDQRCLPGLLVVH